MTQNSYVDSEPSLSGVMLTLLHTIVEAPGLKEGHCFHDKNIPSLCIMEEVDLRGINVRVEASDHNRM